MAGVAVAPSGGHAMLEVPSAPMPEGQTEGAHQVQPPLPPPLPRPPPAARTVPNPHCQVAAMHAAQMLVNEQGGCNGCNGLMPGFQPGLAQTPPVTPMMHAQTPYDWQLQQPMMGSMGQATLQLDVPPISQMLMREAEAWRALLGLHGSVLNLTRGVSQATMNEAASPHLRFDEQREASEQREATYIAGLSQLMAQCDALNAEVLKIRGLRKAKYQVEQEALKDILRTHADECLAMGDALSRNSALQISSVGSELRQAAQSMRAQIQQARGLLQAAAELRSLGPMPADAVLFMGWQTPDGEPQRVVPVATLLEHVYQRGQLTDENLSAALWEGPLLQQEAPAPRAFARRGGDRQLRQELVSANGGDSERAASS